MSNTIYGTPVGTPISPEKIAEVLNPVKTVNGQGPDDKGNVEVKTGADNAEIEAFIAAEIAKRGQLKPEFANSVEGCTDPKRIYLLPDGMLYAYMKTNVTRGGYTNLVGTSKEGFLPGYRMKAITDEPVAVTGAEAATAFVSNIFPCKRGDIIRIRGVGRSETDSATAPVFMVVPVDSEGKVVTNHGFCLANPAYTGASLFVAWKQAWDKAIPAADGTITWEYAINNIGENKADHNLSEATTAVRLSGVAPNGFGDIIVTVNEEIEDPVLVEEYAWVNTGHAFIPPDYEERILDLEKAMTDMGDVKERTADLEEDMDTIKKALPFDGLLNHGIFDYAYIKNGELVANALDITGNQHGHYTGVKMTGNVKRIMCKAKILPNSSVVLISTKLGSSVVANITRGSLHVIFNSNGCAVGIYDGGTEPLRNVVQYPCPVSADAEVDFGYAVDEITNTMTIYLPDGTTKTVTDDAISTVNGEYAIWEHYCNTSSVEFRSCRITKLWCSDINGDVLDDDLKRFDGAIGVAPTGQVYRQFRTGQQINRDFK